MGNTVALVAKFQPILDEVYKAGSLTAQMDSLSKPVSFAGANVVKVFKTTVVGLGDYNRSTGYKAGDVTGEWETLTLAKDRAREWSMDRMDDEETLGMAFGTLAGEAMRTGVIPEVDAYRFATYSSWSGVGAATPATYSNSTILAALDLASTTMDEAEVPDQGRILFMTPTVSKMVDQAITRYKTDNNGNVSRIISVLDNMRIVKVPQTRFYTAITLNAGATSAAGGFAKAEGAKDLNFVLVHPSSVVQVAKHENLKIFDPDTNQDADAWKIQYRLYHDCFVLDSKKAGIYYSCKA